MEHTTAPHITRGTLVTTKQGKPAITNGEPCEYEPGKYRVSYRLLRDGVPFGPSRYTDASTVEVTR